VTDKPKHCNIDGCTNCCNEGYCPVAEAITDIRNTPLTHLFEEKTAKRIISQAEEEFAKNCKKYERKKP